MTYNDALREGFAALGLPLTDKTERDFTLFYGLLSEKNKVMDLTAVEGGEETAAKHMTDSAALLSLWDFSGKSVIDVGCGAGFPSIPLLICENSIKMTCLDSQNKRLGFIKEVLESLGLVAEVIHGRAEVEALKRGMRENFDIAVSRAVAPMNVLCELCLPFVKTGGAFIAMKSVSCEEELEEAKKAIKLLGGEMAEIKDYSIKPLDITHRAVMIKKIFPTDKRYPRRFSKIKAKPLA